MISADESRPAPLSAEDVESVVDAAVSALRGAADADWQVPAQGLEWTCWETVEHVSDDLFAYAGQLAPPAPPLDGYVPFGCEARREGGPSLTVYVKPEDGVDGQLMVLAASGGLLAAQVRTRSPRVRAGHPYGSSDPEGFAAMGVVEVLVHLHDVAGPLGISWTPDDVLCRRVLTRLFPDAPLDTPGWATLLWATGRGELDGHARLDDWRWDSTVRAG
ncbi:hypothetical protein ACPPVT_14515 [Angustibacter sp. McL0619]|uniref:hypothetical protein n=1 Tax=Angustibacter sp. McL0619 TaxID=3415676 RepID=UPI003CEA3B7C